jgi:hypothetical protein
MASKKGLLDHIPESQRVTIAHKDNDGVWRVESRQDTSHIARAASILSRERPGKDFRLIGFIPETDLNQMFIDGSFHDPKAIERWLDEHSIYKVHKA